MQGLVNTLRNVKRFVFLVGSSLPKYRGVYPRKCPMCGYSGLFRAFGNPPRWDSRCPNCQSLERHRLLALFLDSNPGVVRGKVVHFAPEDAVAGLLRKDASEYLSADLFRKVDLKLDLEALDLEDESVDLFVCSHLLEHVDDRKALAELHRCLRPGGSVIVMVPIIEAWRQTYENQAVDTADGRTLHFGQDDHVRFYGADLRDRIRGAGFELSEFTADGETCVLYGLIRGETVFLASKPSPALA